MHNCYNFRQNTALITSSGEVTAASLQRLSALGYQLVINLLPDSSEYALRNEKEIIEPQDILYIHIPVDFADPTENNYHAFYQAMSSNNDKKIHIHCAANYRASAFYAIYNVENNNWSVQQGKEFIAGIWDVSLYPAWQMFLAKHNINING